MSAVGPAEKSARSTCWRKSDRHSSIALTSSASEDWGSSAMRCSLITERPMTECNCRLTPPRAVIPELLLPERAEGSNREECRGAAGRVERRRGCGIVRRDPSSLALEVMETRASVFARVIGTGVGLTGGCVISRFSDLLLARWYRGLACPSELALSRRDDNLVTAKATAAATPIVTPSPAPLASPIAARLISRRAAHLLVS